MGQVAPRKDEDRRPLRQDRSTSDTVHGVEGVPLQVADVKGDVRIVAKHCKAADRQ